MTNKAIFKGKNFETVVKKISIGEGVYFILGMKDGRRNPLSMCKVKNNRMERRRESLRKRFSMPVVINGLDVDRETYLVNLMAKNSFDEILIEWEEFL